MKYVFFVVVGICLTTTSLAQDSKRLSLAVMNESMAFPFTRYNPIHPGLEMGYAIHENERARIIKAINLHVGWYFHRKVENAFYVRVESAWQIKIKDAMTIDLFSGIGYMHIFYPGEVYELNSNTGDFEKINQTGRPHLLGNLGIGFTYRNDSKWEPFVRQDIGIETPFANGIPVMVHSFLKAGTYLKLNNN